MRADKPYIDYLRFKDYDSYQPVIIAADIKNKAVVADAVCGIESLLNLGEGLPAAMVRFGIPVTQSNFCIRIGDYEFPDLLKRNDTH